MLKDSLPIGELSSKLKSYNPFNYSLQMLLNNFFYHHFMCDQAYLKQTIENFLLK